MSIAESFIITGMHFFCLHRVVMLVAQFAVNSWQEDDFFYYRVFLTFSSIFVAMIRRFSVGKELIQIFLHIIGTQFDATFGDAKSR